MASDTKSRESWDEQETSNRNIAQSNQLKLSRVFRFNDPQTGAPQISDFPDSNPAGDTPLEIRMKHFTEIENFTFLAHVLGHELGGTTPRPIRTVTDLQVPDDEFQNFVNTAKTANVTDEELADSTLDVGINWEHFVASNDNLLLPDHPLKITPKESGNAGFPASIVGTLIAVLFLVSESRHQLTRVLSREADKMA